MVRLGMSRVFEEAGIEVVGEEEQPDALVRLAAELRPDIVVLDLWTRDEEVMEVLDPGATTPRRFFDSVPQGLRDEVQGTPAD
jgi:DNA-binding NarL/FixJ family response regulator